MMEWWNDGMTADDSGGEKRNSGWIRYRLSNHVHAFFTFSLFPNWEHCIIGLCIS
jgi:hypothetical protein